MTIGRISTYALHQHTLKNASLTQSRLAEAQIQLSSGFKSQDFEGIADQSQQFLSLEFKITKGRQYINNNKLVETRMNATTAIIDQVIDTANKIKNLIMLRRSNESGDLAFDEQLEGYWKNLVNQLNTTSEGRYLFAGTKTDSPAVDDTFPVLNQSGVPDTKYYLGSPDDMTVRIEDNVELTYNVRADESGFQKIFAAIAMAKKGSDDNSDVDLKTAFDLADAGIAEMIDIQGQVNANKIAIQDSNIRHESLEIYWKSVKEEIINTDLVAVSTEVALNQAILQASFQAFARINSLRLVDFLS